MGVMYVVRVLALFPALASAAATCSNDFPTGSAQPARQEHSLLQMSQEQTLEMRDERTSSLPVGTTPLTLQVKGREEHVLAHVFGKGGPVLVFFAGRGSNNHQDKELWQWSLEANTNKTARSNLVNGGNFVLFTPNRKTLDVTEAIVDKAATFSNCDLTRPVTVYGSSAGCAAVHALLMRSRRPELRKFGCFFAQLAKSQKRLFERLSPPANLGRTLWTFVGSKDKTVPYEGGRGNNNKKGYTSVRETSEMWASLYADGQEVVETTQDETQDETMTITKHSFIDDRVAWWVIEGIGHGTRVSFMYEKMAELVNRMDGDDGAPGSSNPTQSPTEAPCVPWCATSGQDWVRKCTYRKLCAGCTSCDTVSRPCMGFCARAESDWSKKCMWYNTCGGCEKCFE